jgi:P-type Cu+ transporter
MEPPVDLDIDGMTCASCAAGIETRLNRIDGVEASVNYATERCRVALAPGIARDAAVDQVIRTVEEAGYRATLPPPADDRGDADRAAHDDHRHAAADMLRARLLVSAALAVPVVAMGMIHALQFTGWEWVSLALATPVVLWGAAPFHRMAWSGLRHGRSTMDTLISVGTLAAYGWSVFVIVTADGGDLYLEVAAAVTVFVLAGRYAEERAARRSGAALRALLELGAKQVSVLRAAPVGNALEEVRIPISELEVDDRFVVRPGEKVATDGVVDEGTSAIDASLLTGESVPVEVGPGDAVTGATVNEGGRLVVRATRVGSDTALAQIARLVTDAQAGKAPVQRLADRVSAVFVPVVIGISILTLVGWLASGAAVTTAFSAAVAVLIIACPCALGLATPTALLVGTGRGAQLGILIKGPQVLESTRRVDTVLLDKTGTVTSGRMRLVAVTPATGVDPDDLLRSAGAIEDASEHPIGRAIAAGARERLGALPPVDDFDNDQGRGVRGVVDGRTVFVGREPFVAEAAPEVPSELVTARSAAEARGQTAVIAAWDGEVRGLLVVSDTVKPTSAAAVERLRSLGLTPVLLTGDHERSARSVAATVGIDRVIAEVLPAGKVDVVRGLQDAGHVVAMVGDGVNDAAALAQADLGISMGTGADVAIEASDLTLVRGDLRVAADAVRLSRRTLATIRGNLFWAFAYNVAAIPLAAAGVLDPMIAGAAMALSSVFVVSNSLRLRRFRADAT